MRIGLKFRIVVLLVSTMFCLPALAKESSGSGRRESRQQDMFVSSGNSQGVFVPQSYTGSSAGTGTNFFWLSPDISGLVTGAVSTGFTVPQMSSGRFNLLDFNPMFLFRYKDLAFLHADLDFALDDDGNTTADLGNLNLNLFINDLMVFAVGSFDSPLGYFVQNLGPPWINRLPDAPVGFDGDEAAPQAELGLQVRGGFYFLSKLKMNYTTFFANGPRAYGDPTTGMIDHIGTDAFPNNNNNFIGGGRLGILPIPNVEIGISGAGGKVALYSLPTGTYLGEAGRNYQVIGADLSIKKYNWDLRAEVIQQRIQSQANSQYPDAQKWKAWYLQAAYWIPETKFEPVVRWGGYSSAVYGQSVHQVALGVDYWFAPSLAIQAAYEINKAQLGTTADNNLFLVQLVFGF